MRGICPNELTRLVQLPLRMSWMRIACFWWPETTLTAHAQMLREPLFKRSGHWGAVGQYQLALNRRLLTSRSLYPGDRKGTLRRSDVLRDEMDRHLLQGCLCSGEFVLTVIATGI
ncbi:hypothetical protein PCAR4_250059 [Paraburkholderia caribensis]|nr:hypothetical protein PCAR4_250059 [Paraburkholderia caribensis]